LVDYSYGTNNNLLLHLHEYVILFFKIMHITVTIVKYGQ